MNLSFGEGPVLPFHYQQVHTNNRRQLSMIETPSRAALGLACEWGSCGRAKPSLLSQPIADLDLIAE